MEVHSLRCKDCGAPLSIARNATLAACNYCGSQFGIKHSDKQPEVIILEAVGKPPVVRRRGAAVHPKAKGDASLHGIEDLARGCFRFGFVFTIVSFVVILGVCGFLWWCVIGVSDSMKNLAAAPVRARADGTAALMEYVAESLDSYANSQRILPDPTAGNALTQRYHDEWGRPLRYEQNSASDFVIRSAGPDGKFDTLDDLARSDNGPRVRDRSRLAQAPDDRAAALRYLATPGRFQKQAGLAWLLSHTTELDEAQRALAVEAAIQLLQDRLHKEQAQTALNRWSTESDADRLVQAAALGSPRDEQYVDAIVLNLIRLEAKDGVLQFLNHPSRPVRASVSVAISDWRTPATAIIEQSLADLSAETTRAAALERLKAMEFDSEQRARVTSAVKLLLMDEGPGSITRATGSGLVALDILRQTDIVDVPLLMKVYRNNASVFVRDSAVRDRAGQLLAQHPEPRVCLFFAEQLANRHEESAEHAKRLLKEIGPAAESYLWPTLLGTDRRAQSRACDVLAAIGTEKSVAYLEQVDGDNLLANEAKAAVVAIRSAARKPADVNSVGGD